MTMRPDSRFGLVCAPASAGHGGTSLFLLGLLLRRP
jgi:hypothetical protein